MRICIVCPVRNGVPHEVIKYVKELETDNKVFFPPRDIKGDTPDVEICRQMMYEIQKADEVHVWYDENSQGVHFDMGLAFALRKPVKWINDKPYRLDGDVEWNWLPRGYETVLANWPVKVK